LQPYKMAPYLFIVSLLTCTFHTYGLRHLSNGVDAGDLSQVETSRDDDEIGEFYEDLYGYDYGASPQKSSGSSYDYYSGSSSSGSSDDYYAAGSGGDYYTGSKDVSWCDANRKPKRKSGRRSGRRKRRSLLELYEGSNESENVKSELELFEGSNESEEVESEDSQGDGKRKGHNNRGRGKKGGRGKRGGRARGKGKGKGKGKAAKACPHNPANIYIQRSSFIIYVRKFFRQPDGKFKSVIDHLLTDPTINETVPRAQDMLGWNMESNKCDGEFNGGMGPVCAITAHKEGEMHSGMYNQFFVQGSDGKLCRKDRNSGYRRMSKSQITAIVAYSADEGDGKAFYDVLNQDLHNVPTLGRDYVLKKWSIFMYWFLGAANCLDPCKNPKILYRGMNTNLRAAFKSDYSVGRYVIWTGLTSTTSDMNLASTEYASKGKHGPAGAVMFEVTPTIAYPMIPFSKYQYEMEYILPPMSLFTVTSSEEYQGMLWIKIVQQDKKLMEDHCIQSNTYVY